MILNTDSEFLTNIRQNLIKKQNALQLQRQKIDRDIAVEEAGHPNQDPRDYGKISGKTKMRDIGNHISMAINETSLKILGDKEEGFER